MQRLRALQQHICAIYANCQPVAPSLKLARAFSAEGADDSRRQALNRVLYRCKQRGQLELDLLVGEYAEQRLARMTDSQLAALDQLLQEENPMLFKWLTRREVAPAHVASNEAYQELAGAVSKQLDAFSAPQTRAAADKEWVNPWLETGASPKA